MAYRQQLHQQLLQALGAPVSGRWLSDAGLWPRAIASVQCVQSRETPRLAARRLNLDLGSRSWLTVYFNHLSANADGKDYVQQLLDDNTFGFEDTVGGGDMDFDDVVVKIMTF